MTTRWPSSAVLPSAATTRCPSSTTATGSWAWSPESQCCAISRHTPAMYRTRLGRYAALALERRRNDDFACQPERFQHADDAPRQIELVRLQAMTRRGWESVVIVMPSFAGRDDRQPRAVGRAILGGVGAIAPRVRYRIHRPRDLVRRRQPEEDAPKHPRPTADQKQHDRQRCLQ